MTNMVNVSIANLSSSWTDPTKSYTGLGLNINATSFDPSSKVFRLKVNGNTVFSVDASGTVSAPTIAIANAVVDIASPFDKANGAFLVANSGYTTTNAAYTTTNAAFSHSNITYNAVNSVFGVANAAFASANNVAPQVAPAYNTANAAFNVANSAYALQNNDYTMSNAAYTVANAAFGAANNKVSSVSGTSGRITSSGGLTPTIDLATAGAGAATYQNGIGTISIDAYGRVTSVSGSYSASPVFSSSASAPIYYDSDNTAFYVDPNATSVLNAATFAGLHTINSLGGIFRTGGGNYGVRIYPGGGSSSTLGVIQFTNASQNTQWGSLYFESGYAGVGTDQSWPFHIRTNGSNRLTIDSTGFVTSSVDHRAPVFYDSNDTAYFCDPNSRSRLSSIDYGNSGYYFAAGDWGFRHYTPSGWIQFGPANSGHAHIYTDRSNFYFNVDDSYLNGRAILMQDRWLGSKYFSSDGAIYGTIFYDANDSGYYVNPNSTSFLNFLNVGYSGISTLRPSGGADGANFNTLMPNYVYYGYIQNSSNKPSAYGYAYGTFWDIFPGGYGGAQFYVSHAGNDLCFRGHWGYQDGYTSWNRVLTDQIYSGYCNFGTNEVRGGRFVDGHSTGYYCDPAGTSVLASIEVGALGRSSSNSIGSDLSGAISWNNSQLEIRNTNGGNVGIAWHRAGYSHSTLYHDGGSQLRCGGILIGDTDVRGPVFYDLNDTGFYCDPNNTTNLNTLYANFPSLFQSSTQATTDANRTLGFSSSWTTHLSVSFTMTKAGPIYCGAVFAMTYESNAILGEAQFVLSGAASRTSQFMSVAQQSDQNRARGAHSLTWLFGNCPAGSYTLSLQVRNNGSGSTWILNNYAGFDTLYCSYM